jgi:hypothetical protein
MNNKQTAVDLMYQRAITVLPMGAIDARQKLKETYEQAKEMETKKLKDAYEWGQTNGSCQCNGFEPRHENFEQYYNETYGGNK